MVTSIEYKSTNPTLKNPNPFVSSISPLLWRLVVGWASCQLARGARKHGSIVLLYLLAPSHMFLSIIFSFCPSILFFFSWRYPTVKWAMSCIHWWRSGQGNGNGDDSQMRDKNNCIASCACVSVGDARICREELQRPGLHQLAKVK